LAEVIFQPLTFKQDGILDGFCSYSIHLQIQAMETSSQIFCIYELAIILH